MKELNPNKRGIRVNCAKCGLMKQPRGRSAPFEMSYCNGDCPGYDEAPRSGDLWPGESEADFGYQAGNDGTETK